MNHSFRHGSDIEAQICELLPDSIQTEQRKNYDIEFKNVKIEVKASEIRTRNGKVKGWKWGRFRINPHSHKELKKGFGWYCLVLTFKEEIILKRFVESNKVKIRRNKTYYFIPFQTLYFSIGLEEFLRVVK